MGIHNVSAVGFTAYLVSTVAFPYGFELKNFPADGDPISVSDLVIRGVQMDVSGKIVSYRTAKPVELAISVIPASDEDANLSIVFGASKINQQLIPVDDTIILTVQYPDGGIYIYTDGSMISGPAGRSVANSGNTKSNVYKFTFGDVTPLGTSLLGTAASLANIASNFIGE